jgi:aryl-alcohol dehydrogenase-like predicted oxidoreductase
MTNSKGSPVVVGGATSAKQVVQNVAAGGITLSAADPAEIEVSAPGPVHV